MIEPINQIAQSVIYRRTENRKITYAVLLDYESTDDAMWMDRESLVESSGLPSKVVAKVGEGWIAAYDIHLDEVVGFFPNLRAIPPCLNRLKDSDITAINKQINGEHLHVKGYLFCRLKTSGSLKASSKWAKQSIESDLVRYLLYVNYDKRRKFSKSQRVELISLLR